MDQNQSFSQNSLFAFNLNSSSDGLNNANQEIYFPQDDSEFPFLQQNENIENSFHLSVFAESELQNKQNENNDEKKNQKNSQGNEEFLKLYPALQKMESKLQRKEIQKIKNRISAQSHRDKQKIEMSNLKEENRILKLKINSLEQKQVTLLENIQNYTCKKCGQFIDFEKQLMQTRLPNFQRVPSNSCLLRTLTILSVLFLFSMHDKISLIGEEKTPIPNQDKLTDDKNKTLENEIKKMDEEEKNKKRDDLEKDLNHDANYEQMEQNMVGKETINFQNQSMENLQYEEAFKKDYGVTSNSSKSKRCNKSNRLLISLFWAWIFFITFILFD